MALSTQESMIAGAIVVAILVFVAKSGKDKEEEVVQGEPPKPPDGPRALNEQFQKQLAEIEAELDSLMEGFDFEDAEKSGVLPRSPPVRKIAESLADRMAALRGVNETNRRSLPSIMREAFVDFDSRANQVEKTLDDILKIGSDVQQINMSFNQANISHTYETQQYINAPTIASFDQREYQHTQNLFHSEQRTIVFQQGMDADMEDRADFHNRSIEAPDISRRIGADFVQIKDGNDDSRDRQVAMIQDRRGLNANGPRAVIRQAAKPVAQDNQQFEIMGPRPMDAEHTARGATMAIEGSREVARRPASLFDPPARDPAEPSSNLVPGLGGGNLVGYGSRPNFDPSASTTAGDGDMEQQRLEGMNRQLKRLTDSGQASSVEAVELAILIMDKENKSGQMILYDPRMAQIEGQQASYMRITELYSEFNRIVSKGPTEGNKKSAEFAYRVLSGHTPKGIPDRAFSTIAGGRLTYNPPSSGRPTEADIRARLDFQWYQNVMAAARIKHAVFRKVRKAEEALNPVPGIRASEAGSKRRKVGAAKAVISNVLEDSKEL